MDVLSGYGKPYIVNVSAYVVHVFSGTICSRKLKHLHVIYERFDCDLAQGIFYSVLYFKQLLRKSQYISTI